MLSNIRTIFLKHFSKHITLYFLVTLCFFIGIASGVFSVKALNQVQKEQLIDYLASSFKATLVGGQINSTEIFFHSVINNLKTALLMWMIAVSIIGFPLIFIVLGIRGFILGFTIGFMIENLALKGVLFCIVSILPQNLIIIPALLVLSVVSVDYCISFIKSRKYNKYIKKERLRLFIKYTLLILLIMIFLLSGSLFEGYVTPMFLKGILGYLLG